MTEQLIPLGAEPEAQSDGHHPYLRAFLPDAETATGSAMLIYPGGSYTFLSDKSGEQYGRWLAAGGIAGFVVNFRLGSAGYRYPSILDDGWQALRVVRRDADRWGVDRTRVGVIGTSAGGHLVSLMATGTTVKEAEPAPQCERPAVCVLCYPVISLQGRLAHAETLGNFLGEAQEDPSLRSRFSSDEHVDLATPPCFLWHTFADAEVSVEHTLNFSAALREYNRPHEIHLYETGEHALGLAHSEGFLWSQECLRWLRLHGF